MADATPDLKTRLLACIAMWTRAHDCAEGRFGKAVAGDANFARRLRGGGGLNLDTLERSTRFLHAPENWPEGLVPAEVCDLAHRVGVSGEGAALSAGKAGDVSSRERAA